jgi:hypothetical protein
MSFSPLREHRSEAEYNPFQHPPALAKAVKHYRSTLVGANIVSSSSQLCECCYRIVDKRKLSLRCPYTELGFISVSIALYFWVIQLAILLLAVVLLPAILLYLFQLELVAGYSSIL